MSGAVRSRPRRSAARSASSLPYARPKQPPAKKSPWSIATGLLSYLNPLRLRSASPSAIDVDDDDDEEPSFAAGSDDESPPESLSARGHQMAHNIIAPSMQSAPVPNLLSDSSSPEKNLRTVANFLEQRRGQTISPLEAEGLISLIHKSTPPEKTEPFRFSSSVPSTPARGNSPAHDLFTLGASTSTPALGSSPRGSSPRKTLAKNPNGTYRWSGGGSARPSKNRYASPAFGTSSRASSPRLVFQDSPSKTTEDASPKRRRLETPPAATPPPVPRSAAPGPSPTRVAASQYFPFPHSSTPASSPVAAPTLAPLTPTASLLKTKTLPANPSPLRQAWGGSPASSISSTNSSPAQGTPTKAATLLSALIRDADAEVPKRSADVRNPYQSASPVGVRVTNTHPSEAATRKRARATGRPAAREAEKQKEKEAKEKAEQEKKEKEVIPPQAIIEATLPKGSKRSRPPANFNASASLNSLAAPALPSPRRSPRLEPQSVEVEEDAEDKDEEERDAGAPATKRARLPAINGASAVNGDSNGTKKDVSPAPAPAPTPAASQPFTFPASTSTPSVFGNNGSSNSFSSGSGSGSTPVFTMGGSASTSSNATSSGGFEFRVGPKPLATAPKEPSKLRYSFAPPPTPPPVADKPAEKTLFPMDPPPPPKSAFTGFGTPATTSAPVPSATLHAKDPKDAARALMSSTLPSYVFTVLTNAPNTSDAHTKARDAARRLDKSALPAFDFSAPAVVGKGKGKEKETAPVQGFNWAAAGAAPPKPASAPGSWTCGTCMLSNGPEAREKCSVCDAPRPDAPAAPAVQGFNWAAAGAAPPKPASAPGSWTCGTCMLSNGPEAHEKCSVCDAPQPNAPSAPAVKGFNWAAAGAAPPKPASAPGSWTCGTCMLQNGPDVKDKCSVCDSPR
ncbi:hypothetical protein B0H19DRAFT_496256 [Mycena capillaripes]|nr:hypothetical protein B0H19DRAFT_496256 [Mycena capillaripes]